MPSWAWIVIVVGAVVLVALVAAALWMRRRTARLRTRFGPEYERAVERRGRRGGEAELESRLERREELDIRPLAAPSRDQYRESWRRVQAEFVDDPAGAVESADELVRSAMNERGYPMEDFEQRAADISVDHPQVVERYRSAHGIARKNEDGKATTEDLRQAIKHYGALFDDLLEQAKGEPLARDAGEQAPAATEERTVRQ
jgi:FtsZ-interacting cell division protein ZipA